MKTSFTLTPVYGSKFVGRKELLKRLKTEVADPKTTLGFCLYGRRRVGKTSILKELEFELSKDKKVVVAYLSLYELSDLSLKTFTEQLSKTVLEAFRRQKALPLEYSIDVLMKSPGQVIDSALSKIQIGTALSDELKFFLEFKRERPENYTEIVKRAFDLGEKLAKSSKTSFILILDEFPEIIKLENGEQIVKIFRTLHENQEHTTLIISGSEKRTLELVALGSASPFYKQLVQMKVPPFSLEETREFLKKYGLKLPEKDVETLYTMTGGLPFYLQYIGRSANILKNVDKAITEFVDEEGNLFFKEEFEKLSEKEKGIVVAISKGSKSPTEISKNSNEQVTSVSRYLVLLQEKGVVAKLEKATYALVDNLFSFWIRQRYK